jgi:hypothetical protein
MVKIWFDTEFIDTGRTIDLISIGMVRQDGAEYYAEALEVDLTKADKWVKDNVVVHLTGVKTPRAVMAQEIQAFVGAAPEFWAWFGAYDWVGLCQLYGRMLDVPPGWPNLFNEIVHYAKNSLPKSTPMPNFKKIYENTKAHNALADAQWNRKVWEHCSTGAKPR